ncbi:MAG: hypothetical protein HEP71_25010 [Roseivirga sp.]|nr:hypothetical protein [Roseivirga sp.]
MKTGNFLNYLCDHLSSILDFKRSTDLAVIRIFGCRHYEASEQTPGGVEHKSFGFC